MLSVNLGVFVFIHKIVSEVDFFFGELNRIKLSVYRYDFIKTDIFEEIEDFHGYGSVKLFYVGKDSRIIEFVPRVWFNKYASFF